MKLVILNETNSIEKRVAITPDLLDKFIKKGFSVFVEKGAGDASGFTDKVFKENGAKIEEDSKQLLENADVLLRVTPLTTKEAKNLKKKCIVVGALKHLSNQEQIEDFVANKITSFDLELLPRITRAQTMDILSSQTNLSGYRAVIEGSYLLQRAIPLMMTAAGTVHPAKVFVMGAGVAGLQAIATAKRLGAIVTAYDVRSVAKEQVESLGAKFIQIEHKESGEGAGGYAREMTPEYQKAQNEKIQEVLTTQDLVITTAQIPAKKAPILITEKMLKGMKAGSVIVDMATETGGNCQGSKKDKVIEKFGVLIAGYSNLASKIPNNASQLFSKNLYNFLNLFNKNEKGGLDINWDDEIIAKTCITHDGKIKKV
jgi:NAD(P) transhydrogenase subunit alpha